MFDLNEAVAAWRRQMSAGGLEDPEVLNELESHLRDDVTDQMRAGGDASLAFAAAVRRLGPASMLQPEFEKAQTTAARRLGLIAGAGGGLLYLASGLTGLLRHDMSPLERRLGFAALVGAGLLVLALRHAGRSAPAAARNRRAVAAGIAGAGWMLGFTFLLLPQLELLPGPLMVALLWAMNPTIACGAFALAVGQGAAGPRHTLPPKVVT